MSEPTVLASALEEVVASKGTLTLAPEVQPAGASVSVKLIATDAEGIWVQAGPAAGALAKFLKSREPLAAAFSTAGGRHRFRTVVLRQKRDYWLTETLPIEAWLLAMPEEVEQCDGRGMKRYRLSDSRGGVQGKLVRRPAKAGEAVAEISATLWDLSAGGASFVCAADAGLLKAQPGQMAFGVLVLHKGRRIPLSARLVHVKRMSTKTLRLGVTFDRANQPPGSLEMLDEVIGDLEGR